jgi:hypothetical protein
VKLDQKYLESFEMRRLRWMETISWTDRVRNEEVLQRVKEERNILHTVNRRKAHWIGGRDSSVGIATRNRLDGPGIESRWR